MNIIDGVNIGWSKTNGYLVPHSSL